MKKIIKMHLYHCILCKRCMKYKLLVIGRQTSFVFICCLVCTVDIMNTHSTVGGTRIVFLILIPTKIYENHYNPHQHHLRYHHDDRFKTSYTLKALTCLMLILSSFLR